MNFIRGSLLISVYLSLAATAMGQGVRELYKTCNTIQLNSPFKKDTTRLLRDNDKYSLSSGSYRLPCAVKTLYGLPIEKTVLVAYEDTVQAICVFLPFDSTLPARMEKDLGASVSAWMALPIENMDTSEMIRDRRWFLKDLIVWFSYTRYIPLLDETEKDDRIRITITRRRRDAILDEK